MLQPYHILRMTYSSSTLNSEDYYLVYTKMISYYSWKISMQALEPTAWGEMVSVNKMSMGCISYNCVLNLTFLLVTPSSTKRINIREHGCTHNLNTGT